MVIAFFNRLLHWLTVGIMTTVMSLMILSKGNSMENIGVIGAVCSIIVVVLEFPSGVLSDMIGRKRIYLIAIMFSLIGYAILLYAKGFFPVALGFALYGASRAFSSGSIESIYINDYIQKHGKENLHKLIGVMNAGETTGLALGALLGGFLPGIWEKLRPGSNRYNGNLVVQIAVLLFLFLLTMLTTKNDSVAQRGTISFGKYVHQALNLVKKNRIVMLMLIGSCFWGFTFNAIELYWQPQLKSILGSDSKTWIFGIINSGYFIASLLGVVAINFIFAQRNGSYLLSIFVLRIIIGAFIIVLALQTSVMSFSAVYLTMFFFNGMSNIPESTVFNLEIPEENRSSLLSVSSLALQLGGVVGALSFSAMIGTSSISSIWIIAGVLFAISSFVYLGIASK